jgi:hypothetical protein
LHYPQLSANVTPAAINLKATGVELVTLQLPDVPIASREQIDRSASPRLGLFDQQTPKPEQINPQRRQVSLAS